MDCSSTDRICCEYTIIKDKELQIENSYVILNENLGY